MKKRFDKSKILVLIHLGKKNKNKMDQQHPNHWKGKSQQLNESTKPSDV